MSSNHTGNAASHQTSFPAALKTWRKAKRFSQLALALEADVSTRHISFLETGRAHPSRAMIMRLGEAMHLPLSARNQMLAQAGFAPRYTHRGWDDHAMAPVRAAVDHMLHAHAPYPALAIDRLWRVSSMNGPAQRLFGMLGMAQGGSLLDLLRSDHLPAMVENWAQVAHHAAQRLRTENAAQGGVRELEETIAHLARVHAPADTSTLPVVPTTLRIGNQRLSLFATLAQFGTPDDLALDDLKIELYFPADEESRMTLQALAEQPAG